MYHLSFCLCIYVYIYIYTYYLLFDGWETLSSSNWLPIYRENMLGILKPPSPLLLSLPHNHSIAIVGIFDHLPTGAP